MVCLLYLPLKIHVMTFFFCIQKVHKFSTGFCWFYWIYYKDKETIRDFFTDLLGSDLQHPPKDLYVKRKFASYKQEILHHVSMEEYDLCCTKAKEYYTTTIVKSMKAANCDMRFHFGIPVNKPITIDHILSIILYCDLDRYSTQFSETFRKIKPHDTIHSVKRRNSKFGGNPNISKKPSHIMAVMV